MAEDCSRIGCPVPKNAVQEYLNQYSLNQVIVTNNEFTAVINGVTYTIPAGTFSLPITSDTTFPLSYQGCQSNVSISVPPGSTIEQIQALAQSLLQQVASQQAQCNAAASGNSPATIFVNTEQKLTKECFGGGPLIITGALPTGITQNGNSLVCAAGVFSSGASVADANDKADEFLLDILSALLNTGDAYCQIYWNTEQSYTCCNGSNLTIPAHTYFSVVSQAAADAQASAAISSFHAGCPPTPVSAFTWNAADGTNLVKSSYVASGSAGTASINIDYISPDASADGYTILVLATLSICADNPPKTYHMVLSGHISNYAPNPPNPVEGGRIRLATNFINPVYESRPNSGAVSFNGNVSLHAGDTVYLYAFVSHAATHIDATLTITDL